MKELLIIDLLKDTIDAIVKDDRILALALIGRIAEIVIEKEVAAI